MEESRPFLRDASHEMKRELSFKWLKSGTRSGFTVRWFKNPSPVSSHSAVFVTTSLVLGCIILLIIHLSPRTFESTATVTNLQSHNTSFLATETEYLTCGSSLQEAKSKGCQYDILSNHWIPSECADEFSIREYQSDGSWFPYADRDRDAAPGYGGARRPRNLLDIDKRPYCTLRCVMEKTVGPFPNVGNFWTRFLFLMNIRCITLNI
jgi:hypothetical protein